MPDPENGNVPVAVRRRRTHRHRRNRLIRRWSAILVLTFFVASASTIAVRYFSPTLFQSRQQAIPASLIEQAEIANRVNDLNQILSHMKPSRPVYQYSVVPGGVEDVNELRWVAEHDPIVGAHYAGFNFARAQVVRLALARTVYLSYRIGNHIYWTRRRITLKKGEKVITDGRMTARTRCANRVEEAPQQEAASPVEPPAKKFDEAIQPGEGTAMQSPPVRFESALNNRPQIGAGDPAAPLSLYNPFVGGNFLALAPPPFPEGLCAPVKKKGSTGGTGIEGTGSDGKKKKLGPCGAGGPGTVPEPGTWLLFGSGLAAIGWQTRRKLARA